VEACLLASVRAGASGWVCACDAQQPSAVAVSPGQARVGRSGAGWQYPGGELLHLLVCIMTTKAAAAWLIACLDIAARLELTAWLQIETTNARVTTKVSTRRPLPDARLLAMPTVACRGFCAAWLAD
jgi:hypothetical protein